MCGLVGIAGTDLKEKDLRVFKTLLFCNTLRGVHGCGMASFYTDKKELWYDYLKTEARSSEFVFTQEFEEFISSGDKMHILMGHSRQATVGEIKEENNHPFIISDKNQVLIGAHNGTIRGTFEGSKDFGTDSEALFNLIFKNGLKKTLDEIYYDCFSPAYALSILCPLEDKIQLIRNKERPLFLCVWEKKFLWSSDPQFLRIALAKEGASSEEYTIHDIEPHTLVEIFPLEKEANKRLVIKKDYIKPKEYKYANIPTTTYYRGHAHYHSPWNGNHTTRSNYTPVTQTHSKEKEVITTQKGDSFRKVYKIGNIFIPTMAFLHTLNGGCACCSVRREINEIEGIRFNGTASEYYCEECKDVLERDFSISWSELKDVEVLDMNATEFEQKMLI